MDSEQGGNQAEGAAGRITAVEPAHPANDQKEKEFLLSLQEIAGKLLLWFLFSVIIALAPVVANWFRLATLDTNSMTSFSLSTLFSHGELLLISAVLAADAIGSLLKSKSNRIVARTALGGFCVIVILFTSLWFADISAETAPVNIDFIAGGSFTFFVATIVLVASTKILTEG